MRRHAVREIEGHFVGVTPAPTFWWVVAFNDRMLRAVKVFRRMLMWGAVAAADMPASAADPQMHPSGTHFQTFLAAERAWGHVADAAKMRA